MAFWCWLWLVDWWCIMLKECGKSMRREKLRVERSVKRNDFEIWFLAIFETRPTAVPSTMAHTTLLAALALALALAAAPAPPLRSPDEGLGKWCLSVSLAGGRSAGATMVGRLPPIAQLGELFKPAQDNITAPMMRPLLMEVYAHAQFLRRFQASTRRQLRRHFRESRHLLRLRFGSQNCNSKNNIRSKPVDGVAEASARRGASRWIFPDYGTFNLYARSDWEYFFPSDGGWASAGAGAKAEGGGRATTGWEDTQEHGPAR